MKTKGKILLGVILAGLLAVVILMDKVVENVDAKEICVIQDPIDGDLHVYTTPGLKYQNFGTVTRYPKEFQYWFSAQDDQGEKLDQSIKIRFNEGGHAKISGSVRCKMPLGDSVMQELHMMYGSPEAIEQQLVRTVIEKSVYMTGPLMSSKESYSKRRNDLINYIVDQAGHGVYRTTSEEVRTKDILSGVEKTVTQVKIEEVQPNVYARQEGSPLDQYRIGLYNLSINSIIYDKNVEAQIQTQQQAVMEVQTAMAEAKKAEQNAIKAEEEGKANAATAKWAQEVIKAKEVTLGEQKKEVAKLASEEAGFYKTEQILKGEGEAAYKRLVMQADGALKQKLTTYEKVNKDWATAVGNYKGNWVPTTVFNSSGGKSSNYNGAQTFMDIMTIKTANDLSLDMKIKK